MGVAGGCGLQPGMANGAIRIDGAVQSMMQMVLFGGLGEGGQEEQRKD